MSVTLALDLGTHCGFAIARADGRIESGTEHFTPKANERDGVRFLRFRRWLIELKAANEHLGRIVWERVHHVGQGQAYASQVHGGFLATMQMFAEHHQLEYEGYQLNTIKKAWTGKGSAKKPEMIARCRVLGFAPGDDNEADAIALLHLALDRVPALPIEAQVKKRPLRANRDKATTGIPFDPF